MKRRRDNANTRFIGSLSTGRFKKSENFYEHIENFRNFDFLKMDVQGAELSILKNGDIVEIIAYIRNEGRGTANGIDVRCYVNEILIDTKRIDTLQPGSLISTICDTALTGNDQDNIIRISFQLKVIQLQSLLQRLFCFL